MNSIKRIQDDKVFEKNTQYLNIYENYYNKLRNRFTRYDYIQFKIQMKYNDLSDKLIDYEKNKGKINRTRRYCSNKYIN